MRLLSVAQVDTATGLPKFVKDEFDAFLECGILAHGFLRLRCAGCTHDKLVAFSCKRRGFCPSCGARRMSETAVHLVDHVISEVPVRQAPNAKLRSKVVPHPSDDAAQKERSREDNEAKHGRPMRLGWAKLLKRVFNLDLEHCPNCSGELKIIAAILERPAIEKILNHLGLEARAPPRAPARGQREFQDF
jgi:Transposase zinc-binding domain